MTDLADLLCLQAGLTARAAGSTFSRLERVLSDPNPYSSVDLHDHGSNGLGDGHSTVASAIEVVSHSGNRLSLRYPSLRRRQDLARGVEAALLDLHGVHEARANPFAGRVVLRVDLSVISMGEITAAICAAQPIDPVESEHDHEHDDVCCSEGCSADCLEKGCLHGFGSKEADSCCASGHVHTHGEADEEDMLALRKRLVVGGIALAGLGGARLLFGAAFAGGPLVLAGGIAATLFTGIQFLREGWEIARGEEPMDTDLLVAVATIATVLLGEAGTALVVIWLLNLGELLENITLRRTRQAIRNLVSIGDKEVWLAVDGVEVRVALETLKVGDVVAIYGDDKIPADGVVIDGAATVNQAPITGESATVQKVVGDDVYAGTVVEFGALTIRATRVGSETYVGRLIRQVEEARELRAPIETVAERFSQGFVPISFALAAAVFVLTGDPRRAMTMLLIACPCAAGLSTPTAVSASIGNSAKRGVLVKGGVHLEAAARVDTIILDKTGTLSTGKPSITRIRTLSPSHDEASIVRFAAAAEMHSKHPLAVAIMRNAVQLELVVPDHDEFDTLPGRGVHARVNGQSVLVGNRRLLDDFGVVVPDAAVEALDEMRRDRVTALCVAVDGLIIGVVGVSDSIRPEAAPALHALRSAGIERIIMCTGDSYEVAEVVARDLGIDEFYAGALPEDKFQLVKDLKAQGRRVAMVGDGINDAPSLALADVGIAMGTAGSDVAIEAADISLAGDDIRGVATVLDLSRRTFSVIKQNYGLALGVNAIGLVVAGAGALNPILAAVLHNLSTFAVVGNSSRLIGYEPSEEAMRAGTTRTMGPREEFIGLKTLVGQPFSQESKR